MVTNSAQLDLVFGALADSTRRAILARLAEGESTVGQLAAPFDMSRPAISKHLRVLERAGMLKQQRDGRIRRCRLDPEPIREVAQWIEFHKQFWNTQLDSLTNFLEGDENTGFGFKDAADGQGERE